MAQKADISATREPATDKPATGEPATRGVDALALVMGVAFAFLWSSAFTSAKLALMDAPPLGFLAVRFWLSGTIAVVLAWALGQRLPTAARDWGLLAVLGICQNSLYLGLFFIAMQTVPASLAAIIASTMPLLVALLSPLVGGDRLNGRRALGLAIGFGGALWILADRLSGGGLDPVGLAICTVGVLALATATLTVRHAGFGTGLLMVVGLQMLAGAATLTPLALIFEQDATVTVTGRLIGAFLYTVFVPGLIATMLWFALIGRIGAPRAAAFHFLNPGFGVAVAWAVLGEPFTWWDAAGVAFVALGILLVQWQRRATTPTA